MYIHATSPIRRYLDLVAQRQIKGFLSGVQPPYDEKRLDEIRLSVEPVLKGLELVKRNRLRYWILKFLSQHQGEKYKAIVLDEMKSKYRIILADFFMVTEMRRHENSNLTSSQEIWIQIKKANPWEDRLELSRVE